MNTLNYKDNALDLIRLLAAAQVAILHTVEILQLEIAGSAIIRVLHFFPGVPIFFFVSGFLISRAYENSPNHWSYASNRILRIFPGLWVCIIFNLLLVASTGYFLAKNVNGFDVFLLALAKSTILQFYNPDFMRDFGDGVLNGSLWTITVELQFYILAPLLYKLFINPARKENLILTTLIVGFILLNRSLYLLEGGFSESVLWKLFRVSFAPWFYMFLFGVMIQRNFTTIATFLIRIPFIIHALMYASVALVAHAASWPLSNGVNPIIFLALAIFTLKVAYTDFFKKLSRLLRGNDLSYGIYIFHMPILNQFMYLEYKTGPWQLTVLFILYFLVALASWFLIEKSSLKLKKYSVRS